MNDVRRAPIAWVLIAGAAAGCSGSIGPSAKPAVPSQDQYDRLALNVTLADAQAVLKGPGKPVAFGALPFSFEGDVQTMMKKLDWSQWGPGGENYLIVGATREAPALVKHVAYKHRSPTGYGSTAKSCPIKSSKNVSTGEILSMDWADP